MFSERGQIHHCIRGWKENSWEGEVSCHVFTPICTTCRMKCSMTSFKNRSAHHPIEVSRCLEHVRQCVQSDFDLMHRGVILLVWYLPPGLAGLYTLSFSHSTLVISPIHYILAFSPMRSEGFRFMVWGLGVELCSPISSWWPQPSATIRNHPQPFATVRNHSQPSAVHR